MFFQCRDNNIEALIGLRLVAHKCMHYAAHQASYSWLRENWLNLPKRTRAATQQDQMKSGVEVETKLISLATPDRPTTARAAERQVEV